MSGFELIPVHGGNAIHLPVGETILGRGPFLQVSDKRVSRHHGLLDNQDGRLRLKPTHLNPCFKQSSLTDEPQPLEKDVWCPLDHGDVISLLPGQLMFRVVAVGGGAVNSPFRENAVCDNHSFPDSPQRTAPLSPGCHGAQPEASNQEALLAGETLSKGVEASGHVAASPSPRKKRLLPSWMMEAVNRSPSHATGTTVSRKAGKKRQQTELNNDEEKTENVESSYHPLAKLDMDNNQLQGVDSIAMETEQETHDWRDIPTETRRDFPTETSHVTAGTSNIAVGTSDVATGTCGATASGHQNTGAEAQITDKPTSRVRTACPYGKDCYRKNPRHFQECSHPGDSDYEEEEKPEEGERPECPYGTNCYRKNPLHRKEYKHTERTARRGPAAVKARAVPTVASDRDSGDSFIDDESDNVEADSDYVPPADSD
nr:aprataxin and PNK-like factor [Nerophis lumbriciformis]